MRLGRFAQLACAALLAGCGSTQGGGLTVAPQLVELPAGGSQRFTASVGSVAWSVAEGAAGGTIAADGTYVASATPGTFHVTASANGSTATAEVRINGAPQVGIAVDPLAAALAPGAKLQLSATISGPADRSVVWQVQEGDSGGRIDGSGLYTAPEAPGTYHVVAASHAVPGASVTATVSVALHPTITVSIDPPAAALRPGSRLHFAAAVSGTSNIGVQWFVAEGAAGGTIDAGGTYTAPGVEGLFHLVAASDADPTVSSTAEIKVSTSVIDVTVSPAVATVAQGSTQVFTAAVTGGNPRVTWSILEGDAGGSIDGSGSYAAPRVPGIYHVIAASAADGSRRATATVTVPAQIIAVSLAPAAVTMRPDAVVQFTATVTGTSEGRVLWTADQGTITQAGAYTAPHVAGSYRVTALAFADPGRSATATVTVLPEVTVAIDPPQSTVHAGDRVQFRGTVTGAADTGVTWSIQEGAAGGSVDATGLYASPGDHEGVYHVVATSHADPAKNATAAVTVSWFNLVDHGGAVYAATRTFALWWGDASAWPADVRGTQEALLGSLNGSRYLSVADQYLRGGHSGTAFARSLVDTSTAPTAGDPAAIGQKACAALTAAGITPQSGDFVFVYGSRTLDSPTYCAWHGSAACGGTTILTAWLPNPAGTGCVSASRGCNSVSDIANSLATATAHELLEGITNPLLGSWIDANGLEIGDKCEGDLRCVVLGGNTFQIQSEYSNATHSCTVP